MKRSNLYCQPEATEITTRLEGSLLTASNLPAGAQSEGFSTAGEFEDSDWDIS